MNESPRDDRGFMMVALLMAMGIMAVWMTAALPKWGQQVQQSREEELIFRGEQYARALVMFMDKNQGALPQNIDILVSQHFLRKKWKDPVTNLDFSLVGIGLIQDAVQPLKPGQIAQPQASAPINPANGQTPGISGVRSRSTATSIKVYQQQQQHNLWQFDAALMRPRMPRAQPQGQQPGRGGPGDRGGPADGRGGPGGRPGGPGGAQPGRGGDSLRPPPPPPPVAIGGGRTGRGGL